MSDHLSANPADDMLARLRDSRETVPWSERREIASKLGRMLAAADFTDANLELASLLADDPKPEVRKEIADVLVHLPEDEFLKIAPKLQCDPNAYVKSSVERTIARRQRNAQQSQRLKRGIEKPQSDLAKFEGVYGPAARKRAAEIAHDLYSGLVRQAYHDINNIISPIKTGISTLKRQHETERMNHRACLDVLADMDRCAEYLERFFIDMRDYAMATAADADRRRERLADLVAEARNMAFAALRQIGAPVDAIQLSIDVPETATVYVARHQVVMALIHVIRNAFESFPTTQSGKRKRTVRIFAKPVEDAMIALQVADNGPGIHPDDLPVFREFRPRRNPKKRNSTGFGLPTAAYYTQLQGGRLSLDGSPGKGATVTLWLPVNGQDEEA